jgi:hypothetical protein
MLTTFFFPARMYCGVEEEGTNREVSAILESAALCRDHKCKSLAVPESAILKMASEISAENPASRKSFLPFKTQPVDTTLVEYHPDRKELIRGILPSLRYVLGRNASVSMPTGDSHVKLSPGAEKPDSHENPFYVTVDPYGSDYFCKLCDQELSNTYFHCDGCEQILSKDFNICSQCWNEGAFLRNVRMHPTNQKWQSDVHHIGASKESSKSSACRCHAGPCRNCHSGLCKQCSCHCHKAFTQRFRFYKPSDAAQFLTHCEEFAGHQEVKFSAETEARLNRERIEPSQLEEVIKREKFELVQASPGSAT